MSKRRRKQEKNFPIGIIAIILLLIYLIFSKNKPMEETKEMIAVGENTHDALVIIVGNVENSPAPEITDNSSIYNYISEVFYNSNYGEKPNISIISASGNPVTLEVKDKYNVGKAKNDIATKANLETYIKGVEEASSSSPSNGGADYFQAILKGCDYVKDYKNPLVVVYGSGLSDTGLINFAFDDVIMKYNTDSTYIDQILGSNSNIVENEYSNVSLVWYGAGQGVNEQPDLKEWVTVVKNVYADALSYLGIGSKFNSLPISSSTTNVDTDYDVNITIVGDIKDGYKLSLTERILSFKADTATIINEEAAGKLLDAFAHKFNANGYKVVITGYQTVCAKTDTLGKARANAIKKVLVGLGIDENKIEVKGVAGPPDDREESPRCGSTGIAAEHRTVIIEVVKA